MKFQNPSMHGFWRTDARTDAQPETNMLPQLLRSWGYNDTISNYKGSMPKDSDTMSNYKDSILK